MDSVAWTLEASLVEEIRALGPMSTQAPACLSDGRRKKYRHSTADSTADNQGSDDHSGGKRPADGAGNHGNAGKRRRGTASDDSEEDSTSEYSSEDDSSGGTPFKKGKKGKKSGGLQSICAAIALIDGPTDAKAGSKKKQGNAKKASSKKASSKKASSKIGSGANAQGSTKGKGKVNV